MSRSQARFALAKRRRYGSGHSPAREIVQLAVPEQELDGPKILCSSVNKRGFGAAQRVRSVSRRIQTDLTDPVMDDASILTCGEVRRAAQPAWE